MLLLSDVVEADDMIEFVRGIPLGNTLAFLEAFPRFESNDNSVSWTEIAAVNRTASYRSWDGRIDTSKRDGGSVSRIEMLPLSSRRTRGELETLKLEFARNGGTNYDRLADAAYDDATILTREVQNRLELAWGDVLTDGKLTINENGYAGEADFGVPANQVTAAANPWSNPTTGKPLSDIQAWNDLFTASNGYGAGRVKTSLTTRRNVLRSKEVIDAVHGSTAGHTRVTLTELDELLRGEGLPTFDDTYDTTLNVQGNTTRVLAENRVLLLPEDLGNLGKTAWGVTATALELLNSGKYDLTFEEAAGIVGVVLTEGPPFREYVYVDCVAMPVLTNAHALVTALV